MELVDSWNYWFEYKECSPSGLIWRVGPTTKEGKVTKVKAGDAAGAFSSGTKKRCGTWKVKLNYKLYLVHRVIWEIFYGKIPDGLVIDHIDGNSANNSIQNLRLVESKYNSRNQRIYKTNKSGVGGVFLCSATKHNNPFWRAVWEDCSDNKTRQKTKSFSTVKYGYEEAFRMAVEYRSMMIAQLNAQGAGYTERHGNSE